MTEYNTNILRTAHLNVFSVFLVRKKRKNKKPRKQGECNTPAPVGPAPEDNGVASSGKDNKPSTGMFSEFFPSLYSGARLIRTTNARKNRANYPSLFYIK